MLFNQSEPGQDTDVIIYDGYFMLHQMKDVPLIFGNISKKVLQMICANKAQVIIIAFGRYIFPSIKDTEHKLRGMEQVNFRIDGPDQVRKKDFSIELKNTNFKEALVQFLLKIGKKIIWHHTLIIKQFMSMLTIVLSIELKILKW